MAIIDSVNLHAFPRYVCGDGDRDGLPELYAKGLDSTGTYSRGVVAEYDGSGGFNIFWPDSLHYVLSDFGDPDRDGKPEVLLQSVTPDRARKLSLFESRDSLLLPDSLVWSDTVRSSFFLYGVLTDVDADSAWEIMHRSTQPYFLHVRENRGDNQYEMVITIAQHRGVPGQTVQFDDIDRDGRRELINGTDCGALQMYESAGDDSLVEAFVAWTPDNRVVTGLAEGSDIDRDGRLELVVAACGFSGSTILAVYESPSNDSLELVWWRELIPAEPVPWGLSSAVSVGDIDGDSIPEIAVAAYDIFLFKCVGNDSFELIWQEPARSEHLIMYDIDADGRAELLHERNYLWTIVREYHSLGVAEQEQRRLDATSLTPSVIHQGGAVRLTGLAPGQSVQLLDVSGRTVLTTSESPIRTDRLAPGAYFVRISSGNQSVVRKLLVVP